RLDRMVEALRPERQSAEALPLGPSLDLRGQLRRASRFPVEQRAAHAGLSGAVRLLRDGGPTGHRPLRGAPAETARRDAQAGGGATSICGELASMNTPDLKKGTSATVEMVPQFAMDGSMVNVVIVKQRFTVDTRGRVSRVPGAEVRLADEPWDKDA